MTCSSHIFRMHPLRTIGFLRIGPGFGPKVARFSTSTGGRHLHSNPRPTQYQTVIVNEAVNPALGKPFSWTPVLVGLGTFMLLFPCIQTTMELNKYYKETEHLYRDGWSVHHYDKMKNEFLS